jgi:hypothetical protein
MVSVDRTKIQTTREYPNAIDGIEHMLNMNTFHQSEKANDIYWQTDQSN